MSQQSLVQAKTKAGPSYANNQNEVSKVTKQSQNFCGKQIFSFNVILFSGAKRFILSDHKTRALESYFFFILMTIS